MKDKIRSPRLLKLNRASGRVSPSTSTNQRAKIACKEQSLSALTLHNAKIVSSGDSRRDIRRRQI